MRTRASIPVDPYNPGQVFACLGLVELAGALSGEARGGFDWAERGPERLVIETPGDGHPIQEVLRFLEEAEVFTLAPPTGEMSTERWDVPSLAPGQEGLFPIPPPSSPASLPAVLVHREKRVSIHSWGEVSAFDRLATRRDNVKFWGGAGGYPGSALLRDALHAVRPLPEHAAEDPFSVSAAQKSSFRFDWRRDYIPLDAGFSLNEHSRMVPRGYPLVEILAAVGLSHARPHRVTKLEYRYGLAGRADARKPEEAALLPAPFLRAALGAALLPFPTRTFTMHLGWPGKENQARCITTVTEETSR